MNPEPVIRLAEPRDAPCIASITQDLIEYDLGSFWSPARVLRKIQEPDTLVAVAHLPEVALIGFAVMNFADDYAHVELLGVRRSWQRTGIGTRIMHWLEESARAAGVVLINLEVQAGNRGAQHFYRALGYRQWALLPGYYSNRETGIRMTLSLPAHHPTTSYQGWLH